MISSYRLGDAVLVSLVEEEINEMISDYPTSIGGKFLVEKKINKNIDNIDLITNLVLEHIQQNIELLPKDIDNSTVLHLRLGDVVCGNNDHEIGKRPFHIDEIESFIPNDDKMYVIGKCFFAKTSSSNYSECITESNKYLENVINRLGATHFDGGDADIDLCCAVQSKHFIQGKGYFSQLILEIRNKIIFRHLMNESGISYQFI